MSEKITKLGVIIGRFQPIHNGHIKNVISPALQASDYVLFLLGSANRSTNSKNPFTFEERREMILAAVAELDESYPEKCKFSPINDYEYNPNSWLAEVQAEVDKGVAAFEFLNKEAEVTLFGSKKDSSSYYLDLFPQWKVWLGSPESTGKFSATNVRHHMWRGKYPGHLVPQAVSNWLTKFSYTEKYRTLCKEYAFLTKYKSQFQRPQHLDDFVGSNAGSSNEVLYAKLVAEELAGRNFYEPYFITVDSVVLFKGQVLLIKRGHQPGKGLWALPGGFLSHQETCLTSAIREVKEETKLQLKPEWLKAKDVFDSPERSLRGRTVTHGFLFEIPFGSTEQSLQNHAMARSIKASDDAADVAWVPLGTALEDPEYANNMFEDHHSILFNLASKI